MSKLFKSEKSDSDTELNINKDYASNYDTWRQKEELNKLKARYGEDVQINCMNSGEDSSESSEDDENVIIPEEFEKNFYKTLSCLKNKDPRIYNENVQFFDEPEININNEKPKEKKEKALFLRDYERKMIVERGGKLSDSEDEYVEKHKPSNPTYVEEQQKLKESFKKALQEQENEEDALLKPKVKTKEEIQKDEDDYKEFLKGQKENIDTIEQKDLKPLRDFWTDPNLDVNEKFLRDYILNKKFLDKESKNSNSNYDYIAHDSDENLSEDERNITKQEEFEHKYNFRFEEPDQDFIKRYPRTLENSLRKKDTRRAQKRSEIKTRKEQDKMKKQEELKQLKALKRKEIEEKIEKLKEITGNDDLQFSMMDLEEDFDPDKYDQKMNQIFDKEYYAENVDEMKPEFPEIDEELCLESTWDNYDPTTEEIVEEDLYNNELHCEDPEFNMDADYDGQKNLQSELIESTKKRKKRRRTKFAEMILKEKPKFDPTQHNYQKYYDQYYALDYEDLIGDLPCRFKYRQVVPNDYGLSVEEILMADDKELNKWCSLKRALQHKSEHVEINDVKMYKQKASNEALKKKILKSLYRPAEEESESPAVISLSNPEEKKSKRKRKRKKKTSINEQKPIIESANAQTETNIDTCDKVSEDEKEKHINNAKDKKLIKNKLTVQDQCIITENSSIAKSKNSKGKRKIEMCSNDSNKSEVIEKKKRKKKEHLEGKELTDSNGEFLNVNKITDITEKSNQVLNDSASITKNLKNKIKHEKESINNKIVVSKKEKRKEQFKVKNKLKKKKEVDQIASLSAERLKAYGLNPKKFKNKLKYMKKK